MIFYRLMINDFPHHGIERTLDIVGKHPKDICLCGPKEITITIKLEGDVVSLNDMVKCMKTLQGGKRNRTIGPHGPS